MVQAPQRRWNSPDGMGGGVTHYGAASQWQQSLPQRYGCRPDILRSSFAAAAAKASTAVWHSYDYGCARFSTATQPRERYGCRHET